MRSIKLPDILSLLFTKIVNFDGLTPLKFTTDIKLLLDGL